MKTDFIFQTVQAVDSASSIQARAPRETSGLDNSVLELLNLPLAFISRCTPGSTRAVTKTCSLRILLVDALFLLLGNRELVGSALVSLIIRWRRRSLVEGFVHHVVSPWPWTNVETLFRVWLKLERYLLPHWLYSRCLLFSYFQFQAKRISLWYSNLVLLWCL